MMTQNLPAKYQSRKMTLSKGFADSESDMRHLETILATTYNLATSLLCRVPLGLGEHPSALLLFQFHFMEITPFPKSK